METLQGTHYSVGFIHDSTLFTRLETAEEAAHRHLERRGSLPSTPTPVVGSYTPPSSMFAMPVTAVHCQHCRTPLDPDTLVSTGSVACTSCNQPQALTVERSRTVRRHHAQLSRETARMRAYLTLYRITQALLSGSGLVIGCVWTSIVGFFAFWIVSSSLVAVLSIAGDGPIAGILFMVVLTGGLILAVSVAVAPTAWLTRRTSKRVRTEVLDVPCC